LVFDVNKRGEEGGTSKSFVATDAAIQASVQLSNICDDDEANQVVKECGRGAATAATAKFRFFDLTPTGRLQS
jgi:hypothetical protein